MKYLRIGLLVAALLLLSTTLVSADAPDDVGPAEKMVFPNGDGCFPFDMDFNVYVVDDCSPKLMLLTNGSTDVWHFSAKGQLPEGAVLPEQGAAVITYADTGVMCWVPGRVTTDYSIVITPKGKFNINCHFWPEE